MQQPVLHEQDLPCRQMNGQERGIHASSFADLYGNIGAAMPVNVFACSE